MARSMRSIAVSTLFLFTARARLREKPSEQTASLQDLLLNRTSTGTAPTFADTSPFGTAGTPGKFGYSYSAIDFPLWKVGIGSTDPVNQYIVPNGYCYANA